MPPDGNSVLSQQVMQVVLIVVWRLDSNSCFLSIGPEMLRNGSVIQTGGSCFDDIVPQDDPLIPETENE